MATILTETGEVTVAATDGLWLSADDAERATGWALKPEGMCQADLCVPLPAAIVREGRVDVVAFWQLLGRPLVHDSANQTWVLGAGADSTHEVVLAPGVPVHIVGELPLPGVRPAGNAGGASSPVCTPFFLMVAAH